MDEYGEPSESEYSKSFRTQAAPEVLITTLMCQHQDKKKQFQYNFNLFYLCIIYGL